ncbi:MAG: hypothetical protein Q6K90_07825 [Gloeomargarita sp. HHBFW_bins_162]
MNFNSEGRQVRYGITLRAPTTHCSPIKYFTVNNSWEWIETEVLHPGQQASLLLGRGFSPGSHTIQIGAMGIPQGCNTGRLGSWGVQVTVYPVP